MFGLRNVKLENEADELTDQNFLTHLVTVEAVGEEMQPVFLLPVWEAVGEEGVGGKMVHLSPVLMYRGTKRSCPWTGRQTSRSLRDLILCGCCLLQEFC